MLEGLSVCISPKRIAALQMESWLSGRKRHPAKVKSSNRGTVGSNPTGSAFGRTPAIWIRSQGFSVSDLSSLNDRAACVLQWIVLD